MCKDINTVWDNYQKWIDSKNIKIHPVMIEYKGFMPPDEQLHIFRPGQRELPNGGWIPYPVQQVEAEIKDFAEILLKNNMLNNMLEIGLGNFGGTHMLWRELFNKTVSIEFDKKFYDIFTNGNILDNRSIPIYGDSNNEEIRNDLPIKNFDAIFLDGDHTTEGVKKDYLYYNKLVNPKGIIGFHDAGSDKWGVKQFLYYLSQGKIDGYKHDVKIIQHSIEVGIGYIYKK